MTRTQARALRRPPSAGRRARRYIYVIAAIVAILVALDFAARLAAENVLATKIQKEGLQHKPSVSIDGFPFLTQVAGKDFQQVNLSASDQAAGPVTITRINATGRNIRINSYSFSGGTIGSLTGTALISFASLGRTLASEVGPLGQLLNGAGLHLTDAGHNDIQASLNVLVVSGSAVWHVRRLAGNRLNISLVGSHGLPASLLTSIQDITLTLPSLPLGLRLDSVQVTPAGVVGHVHARNVPYGS